MFTHRDVSGDTPAPERAGDKGHHQKRQEDEEQNLRDARSGASDAILHEQTGLLVDHTRLSEALPQAMLRLLQNSDEARHMGQAGRAHAQAQTWTRAAQSLLAAYQAAL